MHLYTHTSLIVLKTMVASTVIGYFHLRDTMELGNFPTNKKCISEQLMRRFIYESECYHMPLPEIVILVIPNQRCTEVHKMEGIDYRKSSFTDFKFIHLPSVSQYSSLGQTDFYHLTTMSIRWHVHLQ